MQNWHIIHTKPHKERQVMFHLKQHQVETYLPLINVNPVNPRAARVRAFFPGYIFVRFDPQLTGLGIVQWTPGVRRMLEFGGQLAVVPDRAVNEIKQRVMEISAAGGLALDGLKVGDAVRITSGPFAGYEAIFDSRLAGTERVRVLLEWVQQNQRRRDVPTVFPVELNASSIEKVKLKR
jgi:transcriptional antiterminator RfaH